MGREKEGDSNRQIPEQPRLEAADGGQIEWGEATGKPEVAVFLRALGESNAFKREKDMQREHQRQSMQRLRQKRRDADLEGFRDEEAAKMRRYRETGTTKPQSEVIGESTVCD